MAKRFDITKQVLRVDDTENLYVDADKKIIGAVYEYDFNPEEFFGQHKKNYEDDECYLSFVTELNIETGDIRMKYWGEFEGGEKDRTRKLTPRQKEFFRNLMEKCCMEVHSCCLKKLWNDATGSVAAF